MVASSLFLLFVILFVFVFFFLPRRCPLLATFLSVLFCLSSLLISECISGLIWFGSVYLVTTAGFVAECFNDWGERGYDDSVPGDVTKTTPSGDRTTWSPTRSASLP